MNITDAEWRVMRVIWERQPASAAQVISAVVPETGWSHRTVRTLLARLVEKGALAAEVDGNRYLYRADVSRSRCIRRESRTFLQKVFGGDAAEMLVHFVRNTRISPEQIAQIKRLLEEKQREEQG